MEYDNVHHFFEGKAPVSKKVKWGYINTKGEIIVPLEYDEVAFHFSEGLTVVTKKAKSGSINLEGKVVIPLNYLDADDFSNGLASARSYVGNLAKWGLINDSGDQVIESRFDYSAKFNKDGKAIVSLSEKKITIDRAGKK